MFKACIDRSDSLTFQHKRRPRVPKYENAVARWPVTGQGFQHTNGSPLFSINFTKSKNSSESKLSYVDLEKSSDPEMLYRSQV